MFLNVSKMFGHAFEKGPETGHLNAACLLINNLIGLAKEMCYIFSYFAPCSEDHFGTGAKFYFLVTEQCNASKQNFFTFFHLSRSCRYLCTGHSADWKTSIYNP